MLFLCSESPKASLLPETQSCGPRLSAKGLTSASGSLPSARQLQLYRLLHQACFCPPTLALAVSPPGTIRLTLGFCVQVPLLERCFLTTLSLHSHSTHFKAESSGAGFCRCVHCCAPSAWNSVSNGAWNSVQALSEGGGHSSWNQQALRALRGLTLPHQLPVTHALNCRVR